MPVSPVTIKRLERAVAAMEDAAARLERLAGPPSRPPLRLVRGQDEND